MTNTFSSTSPTKKRIIFGADHGGIDLKKALLQEAKEVGWIAEDIGTHSSDSVDYPDFAHRVAQSVANKDYDFGVLVCKSAVGMSIAANRHPGARASVVHDVSSAVLTRQHNDSNILCLGANHVNETDAKKILSAYLKTDFEGGRHVERVGKLNTSSGDSLDAIDAVDPEVAHHIRQESTRQKNNIELIASENFTSRAVRQAQGSLLTNKYAEGYPGRRWYGGCEHVDEIETLAIERAQKIFGAEHANVQSHSGSQANTAVYFSVLEPGDKIFTMDLAHGGHLTHGHRANFSGKFYEVLHYGVAEDTETIDYAAFAREAEKFKPKMITAGASAYPRVIDFKKISEIAQSIDAYLFVDMAHIAGLVAAGVHPSPVPYADFVTSTTHKSLRGPRGGIILCKEKFAKKINATVFPGIQGGPLMHVIAAKAVCFHEALQPEFKTYQKQVVDNAQTLASALEKQGYRIVSGGTDNHLLLVDLRPKHIDGKEAQEALDYAGITVNKNAIPFDTGSPMKPSGLRIGTPAVTTRGMKDPEMETIAQLINRVLENVTSEKILAKVQQEVIALNKKFPLP